MIAQRVITAVEAKRWLKQHRSSTVATLNRQEEFYLLCICCAHVRFRHVARYLIFHAKPFQLTSQRTRTTMHYCREALIAAAGAELEQSMQMVGVTAIEDKLQDEVCVLILLPVHVVSVFILLGVCCEQDFFVFVRLTSPCIT